MKIRTYFILTILTSLILTGFLIGYIMAEQRANQEIQVYKQAIKNINIEYFDLLDKCN